MARPATGQVLKRKTKQGTRWALRFNAYGKRQYVTLEGEGWTQGRAEEELTNVLADVRRGIWRPATTSPSEPAPEPTFHEFASAWLERIAPELRPKSVVDYKWQLSNHLLPFFAQHRLSEITAEEVDRYRNLKVRERALSATSINKTITRLAQVLEDAVEYGYLDRNPARGKRRRLKPTKPTPVWLDRAEQITALLDAAGELDREARADRRHIARRVILATLVFAGLRLGELVALQWRDVDLAGGRITVRASKTDAGVRTVDLLPALRDDLMRHKADRLAAGATGAADLVFPSSSGAPMSGDNLRSRVFASAVKRADDRLAEAQEVPLPDRLSPHKLRHTFASLLVAIGVDPGAVMDQLGHTEATFTLRVYRHGMRRTPEAKEALRELVGLSVPAERAAIPTGLGTGAEMNQAPRPVVAGS